MHDVMFFMTSIVSLPHVAEHGTRLFDTECLVKALNHVELVIPCVFDCTEDGRNCVLVLSEPNSTDWEHAVCHGWGLIYVLSGT